MAFLWVFYGRFLWRGFQKGLRKPFETPFRGDFTDVSRFYGCLGLLYGRSKQDYGHLLIQHLQECCQNPPKSLSFQPKAANGALDALRWHLNLLRKELCPLLGDTEPFTAPQIKDQRQELCFFAELRVLFSLEKRPGHLIKRFGWGVLKIPYILHKGTCANQLEGTRGKLPRVDPWTWLKIQSR